MMAVEVLKRNTSYEFCQPLNLYNSELCEELATQGAIARQFTLLGSPQNQAIPILLSEDDYPCWLALKDLEKIIPAATPYQPIPVTRPQIEQRLDQVIAYTYHALNQPNQYLWGGTLPPHYDCSGLMQAAFASVGVWLPRDSYQQHSFTQPIAVTDLQPGDLLFFSSGKRVNHVALFLGEGKYIHSSGKDRGRNGIGIDQLSTTGDPISQTYYTLFCGAGRIMAGYMSQGNPEAKFDCPTRNNE